MQEPIDHHCNQQPDNTHDKERPPTGDVFLGGVSVKAEPSKSDRSHQKCLHDRKGGVEDKDRTERDTYQRCEQIEKQLDRSPRVFPRLVINNEKKNIEEITIEDLELVNYLPYPGIKADMVA